MARDQLGPHPSQCFERSSLAVQTPFTTLIQTSVMMAGQRFAPVRLFPHRDFDMKPS